MIIPMMRIIICICRWERTASAFYYPDYSNIRYEVVVTTEGVTVQEYGFVQTYQVTATSPA